MLLAEVIAGQSSTHMCNYLLHCECSFQLLPLKIDLRILLDYIFRAIVLKFSGYVVSRPFRRDFFSLFRFRPLRGKGGLHKNFQISTFWLFC